MREVPADKPSIGTSENLGASLRAAREARGLSIHKAAQDMHVSDDIVEALEGDDFARLGAPIFVRGHLRNYARILGLPEDEVLAAEHKADKLRPPPLITLRPGHSLGSRWAMPVFTAVVIVALMVLGVIWWQRRPTNTGQPAQLQAANETPAARSPMELAPPASRIPTEASANVAGAEAVATPVNSKTQPQPKTQPASTPAIKPTYSALAATNAASLLKHTQPPISETVSATSPELTHAQFTLSQQSWIEVYDASGKRLYYDLAPAGDTLHVSGAGPLQVFLGNSPGVSIELNGAPFNQTPFTHPDNTARFRLGDDGGSGGQAG